MAVYVDLMRPCLKSKRWPWKESCHLIADNLNELHSFASRLGLERRWFQNDSRLPHYDLTAGIRWKAIACGAVEIATKQLIERMRKDTK